jgi:hypothetical protein
MFFVFSNCRSILLHHTFLIGLTVRREIHYFFQARGASAYSSFLFSPIIQSHTNCSAIFFILFFYFRCFTFTIITIIYKNEILCHAIKNEYQFNHLRTMKTT